MRSLTARIARIVEAVALRACRPGSSRGTRRPVGKVADDLLAFRRAQVDGDRLLAAVAGEVIGALGRAVAARRTARSCGSRRRGGLLDLDHRRAELGQDHAGERAGEHPRQVEDGDVLERFHRMSRLRNARMRLLISRPSSSACGERQVDDAVEELLGRRHGGAVDRGEFFARAAALRPSDLFGRRHAVDHAQRERACRIDRLAGRHQLEGGLAADIGAPGWPSRSRRRCRA